MRASEAQVVLREARRWRADGILSAEQLATIESRYTATAAREEVGGTSGILQALGGLVLGAAAIALIVFLDLPEDVARTWGLLAAVAALAAAGAALAATRQPFADAALVASLVPLVFAAMGSNDNVLCLVAAFVLPPAIGVWRRDVTFVPPLAAVAFAAASGIALASWFQDSFTLTYATLMALAAAAAGWYASRGRVAWEVASGLLVVALAVSVIMFYFDYDLDLGNGGAELVVGAVLLVAVGLGVAFLRRGVLVGATGGLAIDAVVFAFDVGGLLFGVLTLLAVSGALLAAASAVRRYLESSA